MPNKGSDSGKGKGSQKSNKKSTRTGVTPVSSRGNGPWGSNGIPGENGGPVFGRVRPGRPAGPVQGRRKKQGPPIPKKLYPTDAFSEMPSLKPSRTSPSTSKINKPKKKSGSAGSYPNAWGITN